MIKVVRLSMGRIVIFFCFNRLVKVQVLFLVSFVRHMIEALNIFF